MSVVNDTQIPISQHYKAVGVCRFLPLLFHSRCNFIPPPTGTSRHRSVTIHHQLMFVFFFSFSITPCRVQSSLIPSGGRSHKPVEADSLHVYLIFPLPCELNIHPADRPVASFRTKSNKSWNHHPASATYQFYWFILHFDHLKNKRTI